MSYILKTPEGRKISVAPHEDVLLYESPRNPPNTGTRYTRGEDLYAHKARSGRMYFYSLSWSMWQGEERAIQLLTDDEARDFILERAGLTNEESITDSEKERILEFFPDIFTEDG